MNEYITGAIIGSTGVFASAKLLGPRSNTINLTTPGAQSNDRSGTYLYVGWVIVAIIAYKLGGTKALISAIGAGIATAALSVGL